MELLELTTKILDLFQTDIDKLGKALMDTVINNKFDLYDRFCELVGNDLSIDWLQKIYQYYHADRKEKMQDYTPKCIANFMALLVGESDIVVDMCAGSGALTIQRWLQNPNQKFKLFELDENVIPFLLFNLAVRNIDSNVYRANVLTDEKHEHYRILKGVKYGRVSCVKSTL